MAKGHHTQGLALLFEQMPSIKEVATALASLNMVRQLEGMAPGEWMAGRWGVVVGMRPEANGTVVVSGFDQPWPDGMGSPKEEPSLFGAWAMGFFGPFVYPESLKRAVQHSYFWNEAGEAVRRHRGFVRLTSTYVGGADPNALCVPPDYDALTELRFVTRVAELIGSMRGALAYFNSNGEVIKPVKGVRDSIEYHESRGLVPLDNWSNVRMFKVEGVDSWMLMDTVGMLQLDVEDHEACFPSKQFDPNEVANFLRNATDYVRSRGPVIKDGDTMNGPGGVHWRAWRTQESLVAPPRPSLRWFPEGVVTVPGKLKQGLAGAK